MIITDINKLKAKCEPVTLFEGKAIIAKLEQELSAPKVSGIGLSAPQIGINKQVVIVRLAQKLDLINPEIVFEYDLREFYDEGCLSFPGASLTTARHNEIVVRDLLHPAGIICVGIEAVCVAHELDHLLGITMFDREIKIPKVNEKCWCGEKKYKKCHQGKKINEIGY